MNTPYYSTPERRQAFVRAAEAWIGTPFRENAQVCGTAGGVDCSRLALAVHSACGACAGIDVPVLPVEWVRGWHKHHAESRIFEFFQQPGIRERLRMVSVDEPRIIGDMIAVQYAQGVHHLGLWCGSHVVHVMRRGGVVKMSAQHEELTRRTRAVFRIYE